jgi:hypothetical protein
MREKRDKSRERERFTAEGAEGAERKQNKGEGEIRHRGRETKARDSQIEKENSISLLLSCLSPRPPSPLR